VSNGLQSTANIWNDVFTFELAATLLQSLVKSSNHAVLGREFDCLACQIMQSIVYGSIERSVSTSSS
jgi:hypothetical protein